MKNVNSILLVALLGMLTSCGVGIYYPHAQNVFGAQTLVELNQANFRVVRDVEAVVEIVNTNLPRSAVERSAYGQLLRNAKLTGSQVLINVVVEEIIREQGLNTAQYVGARATIIEFLDANGNPVPSKPYQNNEVNQPPVANNNSSVAGNTSNAGTNLVNSNIKTISSEYIDKFESMGWRNSILSHAYQAALDQLSRLTNTNLAEEYLTKINSLLDEIFIGQVPKDSVEKEISTSKNKYNKLEYKIFLDIAESL